MSPSKYRRSSEEDTGCLLNNLKKHNKLLFICSDVPLCWEVRLQCYFQLHTQRGGEGRERKEERKGGREGAQAKSWGRKAAEVGEKL